MVILCKVHTFVFQSHKFSHLYLLGITGGTSYDRRVEYIIPREALKQDVYELVIESSCNGMFGVSVSDDIFDAPDMNRYFSLASAELVVPNVEAWGLLWDFQTLREIVDTLPGNSPCVYSSYLKMYDQSNKRDVLGYKTRH